LNLSNKRLQELTAELANDIKTPEDLATRSAQLTKITVESALKAVDG
jgi:hypothetical protein